MMRRLATSVLLFALAVAAHAADTEFVRVWPRWQDAAAFDRIGEYFGGAEQTGRQVVLRTRAGDRDGYYFLVRVKHAASLAGGKFVLRLIRPDAPEPRTFEFPVAAGAARGETVFQLGLTGADWPGGKDTHPVAWRLDLLDARGAALVVQKSFLWEKPAK